MLKELTLEQTRTESVLEKKIVLFNDDMITFDWVIESLIDICGHTSLQAEQCATIVHFKGKYPVAHGDEVELIPKCAALGERGLTVELQ